MKRIIAFDLGGVFAAAMKIDGQLHTEKITRDVKLQLREHWLGQVMGYVGGLVAQYKPELIFYERPFNRGMAATRMGWGLAGVIEAVASNAGIPVLDMPPQTIKKWASGNGNATKDEMTACAQMLYGYDGDDEHEADAVCALYYAEANAETVEKEPDDGSEDDGRGSDPEAEGAGEAQGQCAGSGGGAGNVSKRNANNSNAGKGKKADSKRAGGSGRSGKAPRRAAGGKGKTKGS